jgi:uncharacterized membrane protein
MNWMTSIAAMARFAPILASALVVAGALWLGTLFAVSWFSGCARMMADGPEIGRLALSLFRRWTMPSLLVAIAAGIGWLALAPAAKPRAHWMDLIAILIVPLLALHVAVGARARRVAEGRIEAVSGEGIRRLALVLSMGVLAALATFRSALVP